MSTENNPNTDAEQPNPAETETPPTTPNDDATKAPEEGTEPQPQ